MSDTICALATASGRSALAVVRLSGPDAFPIARKVLGWHSARPVVPRRAGLAIVRDSDGPIDQALVTFFPGPASHTGEDVVEFSCHGGLVAPSRILLALLAQGARQALAGEFTRRAFLNGRIDLLQVEAVGDLIDATTRAQGRAAIHQLEGGLSRRLAALRESFLELLAALAYDIDFPEEDDGPIDRATLIGQLAGTQEQVERLIATAPVGVRLQRGALVVLAGRPNAGKSSLFNTLLGLERAIVTDIPGTTRDAVEAGAEIDGWPVRLVDTAGLHGSLDPIEQLGIAMSRRYLEGADLILVCVEAGLSLNSEEARLGHQPNGLLVRTKADLSPGVEAEGILVSARDGRGLDQLRAALVARLFSVGEGLGEEVLLTRERHRQGLAAARDSLQDARRHLGPAGDAVLAAHHIQAAVAQLDTVVGTIDFEEVLGRVFARFCVGK